MPVGTTKLVKGYMSVWSTKERARLALIAVANKLIKQCFAIAKSGRPYNETHVSKLPG